MKARVLPAGWSLATILDIAKPTGGGTPSKSDSTFWVNGTIPWVSPKDMKTFLVHSSEDLVTDKALDRLTLIPADSVLVVVRSGILSRTLPVSIAKVSMTVNQDMRAFVPLLSVDARYIAWQLIANERDILDRCAKDGTTVASIEGPALAEYPFAVAPEVEQTRIVEKLEELLSDLDAGVAELKAAQRKLALYRQSLLKAAVEGALTADWRAARSAPLSPRGRGAGGEGAISWEADNETWTHRRARELRSEQTPSEHALWQQLRARRFSGHKFRRQQPLGRYIVDFVCFSSRLIVELDGGQHADAEAYDAERDAWLKSQGFRVLRFWNYQWTVEPAAVLEAIWQALQEPPPLPNPSPTRGEGLESESGAELLQRILRERRARWEQKQLAKFAEQGKAPPKDWMAKYPEPVAPDVSGLPELPEGWVWATVEQLGDVQLGRQRSPDKMKGLCPAKYIRAANITERGIDFDDVLEMDFSASEVETFRLTEGDVLLTEASGSPEHVGRPVVWPKVGGVYCFQNTVLRFKPKGVGSAYAFRIFQALQKLGAFQKLSGGVGINHLSAGKFSAIPLPLPSTEEQEAVVEEVARAMDLIEGQSMAIDHSLKQAIAQRKNILKAAFAGQLVPQDPNDEPASVLLERIRAVRDNSPQSQPRKRRNAKKPSAMEPAE